MRVSCTNIRFEKGPLYVEIVEVIPRGTILYFKEEPHQLKDNLAVIIGYPKSCNCQELACYVEEEIGVIKEIPYPYAWLYGDYIYLCDTNVLEPIKE